MPSVIPGPLGMGANRPTIDDGTSGLTASPLPRPTGMHHGDFDARYRIEYVHKALRESGRLSRDLIAGRLAGIDLSSIWHVLLKACEDIAITYAGSTAAGGAIGAAVGFFAGGVGAVPGAAIGAGIGAQIGTWILGLLGLASLLEYLGDSLPQAFGHYDRGLRTAWTAGQQPYGAYHAINGAASEFAQGHAIVIMALLSAMVAYLTRGRGDKGALLQEIRNSPRLGPSVADWLVANERKLIEHSQLNRKRHITAMESAPARDAGPPMTPSQTRRAKEQGPEPAPKAPEPLRMPQKKVPCFATNGLPQAKVPEFDRQLGGQERGLNDMTVDEYLKGREAFTRGDAVRDSSVARQARDDYQAKLAKDLADELQNEGLTPTNAKAKAGEMAAAKMKTLAALHNPDMIAAGKDVIADMGDRNVNSRIGAQWKGRVGALDEAAQRIPATERGATKMNAKLERCK